LGSAPIKAAHKKLMKLTTGRIRIEADSYGFCGWTTEELLDHADEQHKHDWTEITGGPGKAKLFIF